MSTKSHGSCTFLLLLCFIAASFLPWSQATSYDDFLERHVDHPKTDLQNDSIYCNLMMRRKGMKCQRSNTFIHASSERLTSVCRSGGRNLDGNQTSKSLFPITICIKTNRHRSIFCRYRGKSEIRKIRVTCNKGFPVHYITHA